MRAMPDPSNTNAPRTTAQEVLLRPSVVVWLQVGEYTCEWCGTEIDNGWAIEAAPIPEFFCSPHCFAQDTATCWEPAQPDPIADTLAWYEDRLRDGRT